MILSLNTNQYLIKIVENKNDWDDACQSVSIYFMFLPLRFKSKKDKNSISL